MGLYGRAESSLTQQGSGEPFGGWDGVLYVGISCFLAGEIIERSRVARSSALGGLTGIPAVLGHTRGQRRESTGGKRSEDADGRMSVPNTPSKRITLDTTTTPTTSRIAATSSAVHSSPHYQTTRRHSLYGTEDRIVIDPGSRIWKVGFSGEGRPRDVFFGNGEDGQALWGLTRATNQLDREEEDRLLQAKLQDELRSVFHECVTVNALRLVDS